MDAVVKPYRKAQTVSMRDTRTIWKIHEGIWLPFKFMEILAILKPPKGNDWSKVYLTISFSDYQSKQTSDRD